jgi:glycosyltransferase involved in cell wall biosynthesis
LKANVVFGDLNPCGGGERLSLVTMQALSEMGVDFDLTTFRSPELPKLENAFGKKLSSVMKNIKKVKIVNILEELRQPQCPDNYDITINTHGDKVPLYDSFFSKDNAITYCHFPTAKSYIESENRGYLQRDLNIGIMSNTSANKNSKKTDNSNSKYLNDINTPFNREKEYFSILKKAYWNLMRNSTILTNSEFSRRAIVGAFGIDNVYILSPPVDIDTFRNALSRSDDNIRNDIILIVSRIDPSKEIQNAIKLAKILKDRNIGRGMKIAGSLYFFNFKYYSYLEQMVRDLDLTDYITFEVNASLDKLLSIMREAKVYFHPATRGEALIQQGEQFGMSIVEAMAAGLIPIVPNIGGPTEFVPRKYQYKTLEQAAEIISSAFHLQYAERVQISNSVNKFSNSHYVKGFQHIVNELVSSHRRR